MYLTELIPAYKGAPDPDIAGITQDSRRVRAGWLFAALPGVKHDGSAFIDSAVRDGAVAVIAKPGTHVPDGIALVADDNPRRALSLAAAKFYGRQPAVIAAVTGTNGKTSVADFTRQLWQGLGTKAVSLGTLGLRGADMDRQGSMTTPDPVTLHATLADLASSGIDHLAVEASSHGLHQHRLDGVKVSAAAFTNLTHDHLDYHRDMDEYRAAKFRLFSDVLAADGTAVINADVAEAAALAEICAARGVRVLSYGHNGKDIKIVKRAPIPDGQELEISVSGKVYNFTLPLVGAFQVMNALCALGLVIADQNVRADDVVALLPQLKGVPGRLQLVAGHPCGAVYVDYAHTPDALENILDALRPHTAGRLLCLVGCGGDRDPAKRPVMGRIAAQKADLAVITDDNPRSEGPASIRAAMMRDAPGAKEIGGRRDAIRFAVNEMKDGDILVLAGKGHEQGQIIGDVVEPFDDVTEAQKAIAMLKEGKVA